ncbi:MULTISPECIES: hypothetical protein [unclassified Wenzhouxiangella]|uniref:hypothetical protein n=1 Tax=unclassified Wenzhouxiangella TaxID=2613841 RepID=UPI000E3AEFCF|nr:MULTISPECIES: hypothetical protein [unclassified Wenzhouxiangella]RFF26967.1 hypothetical protein DZK25_10215 [Wenzhouxiangella sp. 15181]
MALSLPASALEVTGSFSGWWDQPEQQNHGAIITISRLPSGKKIAAVYWAHFDDGGEPTWMVGQGEIEGDRIRAQVYEFDGISFMQQHSPAGDFGEVVGTMDVQFTDCLNGRVMFDTDTVGAGEFPIGRLTDQPGVACSGGISDDFRPDHMPREFVAALEPTDAFPDARGEIEFKMRPGRAEFGVQVGHLPEGEYELRIGGEPRGAIEVFASDDGTAGRIGFRSPAVPGTGLLDFDPRDRMIEVVANGELVLAALAPEQGNFMGRGPAPFQGPDDGRFETEIQLASDGVYPDGSATARLEMLGHSTRGQPAMEFDIEVRNIPSGSYPVLVMGVERGQVEVNEIGAGQTRGELEFRFPDAAGMMHFDFDPRGSIIEIMEGATRLFSAEFPDSGTDGGFGMGMGSGMGPGMGHGMDSGVTFAEIGIELDNAGVHPAGTAEAYYEQHPMREIFRVRVANVPDGTYELFVGGTEQGVIEVASAPRGSHGVIRFGEPPAFNEQTLDFDPRGERIEIRRDGEVIFTGDFPN